jgi:uncharacterized membrane protein
VHGADAIGVNYMKKGAAGSWLESHFRWQIRAFQGWLSLNDKN